MYAFPINLSEKLISTFGDTRKINKTPVKLKNIPIIPFRVMLCESIKNDNSDTATGFKPIIKDASDAAVFCIPNMYPN